MGRQEISSCKRKVKDTRHVSGHEVGMCKTETQDIDVRQVGVGLVLANV